MMEANCAKTIRDDLEQVKSYGIKIADENKSYKGYTKIHLGDINIRKLSEFVLGYDLLNNFYKDSIYSECDVNYDFSDYLSRKFIKSEEYQNTKYSTYEMLENWLKNNMKSIKKEYEEFIGKTKDIYVVGNYICIVDDYNYDNPKESIVMIYKNNKDYRNGDYLEQVSLSNDNIRKNIKDYIIDTYNVKNYKEYER